MPSAVNVAGEVASAATALAGLVLVFLGAIASSYGTYEKTAQAAVRGRFQTRAWFAFVGLVLSLLAGLLAVVAKWLTNECAGLAAIVLLFIALIWVLLAALSAVREIR